MPSVLIRNLSDKHGYPLLGRESLAVFLQDYVDVVLFFAENPQHFPECDDVAVILPELIKSLDRPLQAAVIEQEFARELHRQYGLGGWPALVFLRRGEYLGNITKVQDWSDYLFQGNRILASAPTRPPGAGIPVSVATTDPCGTCH